MPDQCSGQGYGSSSERNRRGIGGVHEDKQAAVRVFGQKGAQVAGGKDLIGIEEKAGAPVWIKVCFADQVEEKGLVLCRGRYRGKLIKSKNFSYILFRYPLSYKYRLCPAHLGIQHPLLIRIMCYGGIRITGNDIGKCLVFSGGADCCLIGCGLWPRAPVRCIEVNDIVCLIRAGIRAVKHKDASVLAGITGGLRDKMQLWRIRDCLAKAAFKGGVGPLCKGPDIAYPCQGVNAGTDAESAICAVSLDIINAGPALIRIVDLF